MAVPCLHKTKFAGIKQFLPFFNEMGLAHMSIHIFNNIALKSNDL